MSTFFVYVYFSESTYEAEFQHMLRGMEGVMTDRSAVPQVEGLSQQQAERMMKLAKLPAMKNLPQKVTSTAVSYITIHLQQSSSRDC